MKQEETWECEEGTQSHILSSGTQVLTLFFVPAVSLGLKYCHRAPPQNIAEYETIISCFI
jgi:hypothetical protein